MKKFNAVDFLRDLVNDCASSEREGKQFAADPSKLGPLLQSTWREFTLLTLRYEALHERLWQVHQSDDSKWRVCSAQVSSEALDDQADGFHSSEEALDAAILRCALRAKTE